MTGDFADRLREASKRRFLTVDVPMLGDVRLRSLTAREMATLRSMFASPEGEPNREALARIRQHLVAACVCDEDGNALLTATQLDDIDGGLLEVLFAHCRDHTGFGADSDWKALEAAAKN